MPKYTKFPRLLLSMFSAFLAESEVGEVWPSMCCGMLHKAAAKIYNKNNEKFMFNIRVRSFHA